MIDLLLSAMNVAIDSIESYASQKITLFHHNDTDGISSGAILLRAFSDCGYDVKRYSLEKPYPQILEKVFEEEGGIIVFSDFAGKIAPMISNLNRRRNLVIIIDHHPAVASEDETVMNLDGMLYGIKGDRDISASATAFLFARLMLSRHGRESGSLSHLGVLGAIGDGFMVNGSLAGVNREILRESVERGLMRFVKTERGDEYYIRISGKEYSALSICETLDTLGGVAYYDGGTDKGIQVCLKGLDDETKRYADSLCETRDAIFDREKKRLKAEIRKTKHIQWFDVKDRFEPMGVKMVGVFCTMIKDADFLDKEKYLAGFQRVPNRVPGFGEIEFESSKISMRVSRSLTEKIRSGTVPGLSEILPEATARLGGFSDACHSLSAATTIEQGKEDLLIREIENVLENQEE